MLILLAGVLGPPVLAGSPAQAQLTREPDYVRMSPGEERLVFIRANDVMSYCLSDAVGRRDCVAATCAQVNADSRRLREAGEQARRLLAAAGLYRISRPDLGGVPRGDVRLSHYLGQLKEAKVLPLRHAFINADIDPADRTTFLDPAVEDLLKAMFGATGVLADWIEEVDTLPEILDPRTEPEVTGQSIAQLLPTSARVEAEGLSQEVADGTHDQDEVDAFLLSVRNALRVNPSSPVLETLTWMRSTFDGVGMGGINNGALTPDELPYVFFTNFTGGPNYLGGLLDLLGVPRPEINHVRAPGEGGRDAALPDSPALYYAVVNLLWGCLDGYLRNPNAIGYSDVGARDVATFERAFASVAPVAGRSEEDEVRLYGDVVKDADGNALYQDAAFGWWRITSTSHEWRGRRSLPVPNEDSRTHLVPSTSLWLEFDEDAGQVHVMDWVLDDDDGQLVEQRVATHPRSDVVEADPGTRFDLYGAVQIDRSILGGGILVTAGARLGEVVAEHCPKARHSRFCQGLGRLTVLVEPEGWDDAVAVGVDDEFRVLVNRATVAGGQVVLLQKRPAGEQQRGDLELDGAYYHELRRSCCLDPDRAFWSVDLELPVMRNDRVRFLKGEDPLDREGNVVLLGDLDEDDMASCFDSRYCTYVRPRSLEPPRGDDKFKLSVDAFHTSLELRVSTDPESTGSPGSATYRFDYCLAHRDGDCSAAPPQCTRVTYIEPPRAPNAGVAPILGVASLSDVPVSFFERNGSVCDGTTGTVTVTIDVYGDTPPEQFIEALTPDRTPPDPGPEPTTKKCYVPPSTSGLDANRSDSRYTNAPFEWDAAFDWKLAPGDEVAREAPEWCFLPARNLLHEVGYCVPPRTHSVEFDLENTQPDSGSRWRAGRDASPQYSATGGYRAVERAAELFLVGQRLTAGNAEMCEGSRPRIVGVWGTHVGADNWRFSRIDTTVDKEKKDCGAGPHPPEHDCRYSKFTSHDFRSGPLDLVSNLNQQSRDDQHDKERSRHSLGAAWHARLAAVEPCVGEAECDVWVPPVPGWYQVRIEVHALERHMWHRCRDNQADPLARRRTCRAAQTPLCAKDVSDDPLGPAIEAPQSDVFGNPADCSLIYPDPDGDGPLTQRREPLESIETRFVFDELIWVEAPYLAR